MTKKHYEAIAAILKKYYTCDTTQRNQLAQQGFLELSSDIADYFTTDNKLFNREKFLSACGVEREPRKCKKCGSVKCGYDICIEDIPF